MRRARTWRVLGVIILLGLLALMAPDCTTNRVVLANVSAEPIDVLVRVRDEVVWDGMLERSDVIYVPYEPTIGMSALDVAIRHTKPPRTAHYRLGYVIPYFQDVDFVVIADDGIHPSSWRRPLSIDDASVVKDVLWYGFLFADFMSCVDRDVIRALRGGS